MSAALPAALPAVLSATLSAVLTQQLFQKRRPEGIRCILGVKHVDLYRVRRILLYLDVNLAGIDRIAR